MSKYIPIRSVSDSFLEKSIQLKGWIESVRFSKKTVFVKLYDSWRTHLQPIQIVFDLAKFSDEQKTDIAKFSVSCSIGVTGILTASPKAAQPFEIQATDFIIYGLIYDPATFPIAKAELSLDYLRSFPSMNLKHTFLLVKFGL